MTTFNYDKTNQQRRDKRKSVRLDTFNKTKAKDLGSMWNTAIMDSTVFLSGKYIHKDIETITQIDPSYCIWCIDNKPNGIIAKQLLRHFNRHPHNKKHNKKHSKK